MTISAAVFILQWNMTAATSLKRTAFAAVIVLAAAGCGSGGSKPVAKVGSTTITRVELDRTIEHFRQEARNEGKPFPAKGGAGYAAVEGDLLGLLAYRAQLQLAADKLGVRVSESDIDARIRGGSGGGSEQEAADAFARASIRAQLLYERLYAKVATGVPAARREAVMRRWVADLKRRYPPRYLNRGG